MKTQLRIGLAFLFFAQLCLIGFAQYGTISTVAGNGTQGYSGDGGPATSAKLDWPSGIAIDAAGILYIADQRNNRLRQVTSAGVITTIAGNGLAGFAGDGGPAISAELNGIFAVAVDATGNIYIADRYNYCVRKVTPTGVISTIAGNGTNGFSGDGELAISAQLSDVIDVATDAAGNLFIADYSNHRIRKVTPAGVISTVAGDGSDPLVWYPRGLATDVLGNLYFVSTNYVEKLTPSGVISIVAGDGSFGYSGDGGPATSAQLANPSGVAVDVAGNLYIADYYSFRVRKVSSAGIISTIAGNGTAGSGGDGGPATSAQIEPYDVSTDAKGNLYIGDLSYRVRKIEGVASVDAFFPQVAVGGGYSTLFTLTNTGSDTASGVLTLVDQQGNSLSVNGTLTDSSGVVHPASFGDTFAVSVPPGGTIFLSTSLTANGPVRSGWGQLTSSGGLLTAIATYENVIDSLTQSMVGVLQTQPLQYATIPVDNDRSQSKQLAYAVANPGSQTISMKVALVDQSGTVVDDTVTITLGPGQQIAQYLWQKFSRSDFKGSLVLRGQAGASFIALALLDKQGLLTAVPLIPGKAPNVPN
jgi:hypothetical protein